MSRPERVGALVVAASVFWLRLRAGPLAHAQANDIPEKRKCRRESAGDWHRNSEYAEHEQEHHDETRSRSQPRLDGQCTRCCVAAPVSDAVSDISDNAAALVVVGVCDFPAPPSLRRDEH